MKRILSMISENTNVFVSSFTNGDFSKNFTVEPKINYTGSYLH